MTAFEYASTDLSIRSELAEAYRGLGGWLGEPGCWWTGVERIELASEVRAADACALCRERKDALSPNSVQGLHDRTPGSTLPEAAVDAVHRIVTDATRLSSSFVGHLEEDGLTDGHYVELLGVTVLLVSVDAFHRAAGLDPEPLPTAAQGKPTHYRPAEATLDVGWVPMIPSGRAGPDESDLFPMSGSAPNVLRALSLVPDCVRQLRGLSGAMYIPPDQLTDVTADAGRALDRSQIELVAGRVSAVNECFY